MQTPINSDIYNFGTVERVNKFQSVLKHRQRSLTVVLENIADPHNVAACLRSCDAVGILEVCLIYNNGQQFPKFSDASSASARKWIEKRNYTSVAECFGELRKERKQIWTTHLSHSAKSLYDLDLTQNIALVFGNEHSGVSDEAVSLADGNFLIHQIGVIQSLNISVACAVSVFEAMRQREKVGKLDHPELSTEEIDLKVRQWLLK